jgi:hypothetical protein
MVSTKGVISRYSYNVTVSSSWEVSKMACTFKNNSQCLGLFLAYSLLKWSEFVMDGSPTNLSARLLSQYYRLGGSMGSRKRQDYSHDCRHCCFPGCVTCVGSS